MRYGSNGKNLPKIMKIYFKRIGDIFLTNNCKKFHINFHISFDRF